MYDCIITHFYQKIICFKHQKICISSPVQLISISCNPPFNWLIMLLYTFDNKSFNILKTDLNILSWEWKNYNILRIFYYHINFTWVCMQELMLQSNFMRAIDDGSYLLQVNFIQITKTSTIRTTKYSLLAVCLFRFFVTA